MTKTLKRFFAIGLATLLIVIGLIVLPLPIPFGLILITMGLAILSSYSNRTKRYLTNLRIKHQRASVRLQQIKHYLPRFVQRLIDDTNPMKK